MPDEFDDDQRRRAPKLFGFTPAQMRRMKVYDMLSAPSSALSLFDYYRYHNDLIREQARANQPAPAALRREPVAEFPRPAPAVFKASAPAIRQERRTKAIQRCLSEGDIRPGQNIRWKKVAEKVRSYAGATEDERGFSDDRIEKETRRIMTQ